MMYLLKEEEPKEGPQAKKEKNVSPLFNLKNLFLVIKSFLRGWTLILEAVYFIKRIIGFKLNIYLF